MSFASPAFPVSLPNPPNKESSPVARASYRTELLREVGWYNTDGWSLYVSDPATLDAWKARLAS
jgi:hypothetical protein